MKRDIFIQLEKWQQTAERKPILMRGARQVGKSWLVRQLGKCFHNFVELNFEENPDLSTFFAGNLDPQPIMNNISNYLGIPILPGKTLLFLDEIQACPRAITALRYFYEKMPTLHVIGAGSLIEFELQNISMPVGRIESLYLYPMSFGEFLEASGRTELRRELQSKIALKIPDALHRQLLTFVRDYTLIGGMPEVVQHYVKTQNLMECQQIQTSLVDTFQKDFAKYAKKSQVNYLRLLFEATPLQLGHKFVYTHLSQDIKSRELSAALDLLEMAGLAYRIFHSNCSGLPLGATTNLKNFKVLFFDIGLALRLLDVDTKALFLNPDITLINKGALAELFVGLELIAYSDPHQRAKLYYWHREKQGAQSEVDFVTTVSNRITPIEVKSGHQGRLYSLKRFLEEKNAENGIKISQSPYAATEKITEIPFYGIEALVRSRNSF